jgi:short-subunit dehydrogenase
MASTEPKVWFITGCSKGLGRTLAQAVQKGGDILIATARDPKTLKSLLEPPYDKTTLALQLDVTDRNSIKSALAAAITAHGRIDVLVNNAGYGVFGAIEEVPEKEIRDVFETNVFGALAVTQEALPTLRAQGSGHILNISSIAGLVSGPGVGIYNATKYALEGFSEALAKEVDSFCIKVTLVEPGPFRTDFLTPIEEIHLKIDAYQATVGKSMELFKIPTCISGGQQSWANEEEDLNNNRIK